MDPITLESPEFVFDPKLSSKEKVVYRFNGDLEEQPKQEEFDSSTKSNISLLSSRRYRFYLEGIYSPPTIDPWDDEEENDDDVDDTETCGSSSSHNNGNKIQGEAPFFHLYSIGNGNDGETTMDDKRFIDKTIQNYQWSIFGELNDDSVFDDDDDDERRQDTDNEGGQRKLKFGGNRRLFLAPLRIFNKKRSSAIYQQSTSDPCTYAKKKSAAAATTTPWRIRLSILSKCDVEQEDSLEVAVQPKQKKEGGKTLRKNLWNLLIPSTDNNQIFTGTQLHAKDDGGGGTTIVADDDVV